MNPEQLKIGLRKLVEDINELDNSVSIEPQIKHDYESAFKLFSLFLISIKNNIPIELKANETPADQFAKTVFDDVYKTAQTFYSKYGKQDMEINVKYTKKSLIQEVDLLFDKFLPF